VPTGIYERKNRRPLRTVTCRCGKVFESRRKAEHPKCPDCFHLPWNKGLKTTPEDRFRISETLKDRPNKPTPHFIYTLIDPRNNLPRYVGYSADPYKRFCKHVEEVGETHKCRWIAELLNLQLMPRLSVLCIVQGSREACRIEVAWIRKLKERSIDLTNTTIGGDGRVGVKQSEKAKQKARETSARKKQEGYVSPNKGKKQTPEHVAATKAANTPELLARRGAAIKAGWARRNGAPTKKNGKGWSELQRKRITEGKGLDCYVLDSQVSLTERLQRQVARVEKKLAKLKVEAEHG
jgi:predicted GIY-YIG superfamily endonuclease